MESSRCFEKGAIVVIVEGVPGISIFAANLSRGVFRDGIIAVMVQQYILPSNIYLTSQIARIYKLRTG
ncbi:hypothetical protein KIN20_007913 [Parelaphostrongylus tenuis]|uniref:Uncharacterized protein n=1 Tax=Parelaphostrongylus tenuis TaxID=148309 RepID=A0AAD5QI92_PARTN|nr:hypothetical protein KIN20_007913 [Parelaphostrongylus tenuis]